MNLRRLRVANFLTTLAISLISFSLTTSSTFGQTTWTAVDGNWNDAANWDMGVPGATSFAIIPSTGPGVVTVDAAGLSTLVLRLDSGELALANGLSTSNFVWSGGSVSGPGTLTLNGLSQLSSGDVSLSANIENFSGATFASVNVDGDGGTWTNQSGSSLFLDATQITGTGTLNNQQGAQTRIAGLGTNISWDINNSGVFEVSSSIPLLFGDFNQTNTGELRLLNSTVDFFADATLDGTVSGTGSILAGNSELLMTGTVSPGNSHLSAPIGTLQFGGSASFSSITMLEYEIGATSDLIDVIGGNLVLDGVLNVTALADFNVGTYELFTYNNTLIDNGLEFGVMPAGFQYELVHNFGAGSVSLQVSAVPEPGSAFLLLPVFLFGTIRTRRRRDFISIASKT